MEFNLHIGTAESFRRILDGTWVKLTHNREEIRGLVRIGER
jgi:hypothetical protein